MNERIFKYKPYQKLLSYQRSVVVFEGTICFVRRFLQKNDRTTDQMIQAARSGKQNIVEGAMASSGSSETELKLTNVARASLEELLEDYKDYLRIHNALIWEKDSREALYVRKLAKMTPISYETYREFCETRPGEVVANIMICLIHQTSYLLNRQILTLEEKFKAEGGVRERMTRIRQESRRNQLSHSSHTPHSSHSSQSQSPDRLKN